MDLALEAYVKTLCDKIISESIPFKYLCKQVGQIVSNLAISFKWEELQKCRDDWLNLAMPLVDLNSEDTARQFKSVADRLRQMLGEVNDTYTDVIQPKAELLGGKFGVEDWT